MSSGRERVVRAVAPAKLNLGLAVVGKRADGYHDLLTIFQAIDLADELEFRPGVRGIELQVEGEDGIPEGSENLVVRAAESLAKARGVPPLARVRLRKHIPAGSGLGGGSSDAAAALVALETLWGIESDPVLLCRLALELGSDVPFFLTGGTARGEGRGEILTPLPPPPPLGWLLAIPEFRCSTREVFQNLPPGLTGRVQELRMLELAISHGDAEMLATHVVNDLEFGVARIEPRVLHLKEALRRRGATAVGLTGSGSAMFALFRSQGDVARVLDAGSPLEGVRLIPCAPVDFGARVTQGNDDHRYPDHSTG